MKSVLIVLSALFTTIAFAAPAMQPGLWQITSSMEMPGMPNMPPMTMQHCVKPADIQQGGLVPQNPDPQCKMLDYRLKGNTATWRVECKGDMAMQGTGSMTLGATSYSGTTALTMTQDGQAMSMTQRFSGKRLGDCK